MSILDSIKEAEQMAQKIKQDATLQVRELVLNTEQEANSLSAQMISDAQKKADAYLIDAKIRAEEKTKGFLAQKSAQDKITAALAEEKSDAAVHYIVERIDQL